MILKNAVIFNFPCFDNMETFVFRVTTAFPGVVYFNTKEYNNEKRLYIGVVYNPDEDAVTTIVEQVREIAITYGLTINYNNDCIFEKYGLFVVSQQNGDINLRRAIQYFDCFEVANKEFAKLFPNMIKPDFYKSGENGVALVRIIGTGSFSGVVFDASVKSVVFEDPGYYAKIVNKEKLLS